MYAQQEMKGNRKEGKPECLRRKWRPSYMKRNITLLPFLCLPEEIKKPILIKAKLMLFSRELHQILLEMITDWNTKSH